MLKKIIAGIACVGVIALLCLLSYNVIKKNNEQKEFAQNEIDQYKTQKKTEDEQKEITDKKLQKLLDEIPGIVCWGDDMTAGQGSSGVTYPDELQKHLTKNGINIPVVNMGIADEGSLEVLGRAGAIPFVVSEKMTLAGNGYVSEFELRNVRGDEVHPLIHTNNPGINPVKVNGIDCTFYGYIISSKDKSLNSYYLSRSSLGEDTEIPAGSVIETNGMQYTDYINILCIGQHGGYTGTDDLISQIDTFIDKLGKNKDKYIILGYASGSVNENAAIETALSRKYGEHYLNTRSYLVEHGLEDIDASPTEEDNECIKKGIVPATLRSDENNLNNDGYTVVGKYVYDSLARLGYLPLDK